MKLLICLIALLSLSCSCLPKFPTDRLWEFDPKSKVCGEYQIVQYKPKLAFKHVRDVPWTECPAIFGFTSIITPKVLDWSEKAVECSEQQCAK